MKMMLRLLAALLALTPLFGCADNRLSVSPPSPAAVTVSPPPSLDAAAEAPTAAPVPADALPDAGESLRVLLINVGKADAALLCLGNARYLIDTGTKDSAPQLLAVLNTLGVERLDGVFLTHTHSDHIGGMTALARSLPVERLYAARYSELTKKGKNKITELADELGLPLTRLSAGDEIPFSGGAAFTVLGPLVLNENDDNDNSLVLRLVYGQRTLLFTGDMQFAEEETLLAANADVSCDVLKVGNHGNPDATGDAFAKAASPSLAVISTDTAVDTDSANPRVIAALGDASVHLTQSYPMGLLLTLSPDGTLLLQSPQRPAATAHLTIRSVDSDAQLVTVLNAGQDADLSGCMLFSERGGELFRFPAGSRLPAGETLTVSGENGGGDYAFIAEPKPWNTKKTDAARLYDRFGTLLDER